MSWDWETFERRWPTIRSVLLFFFGIGGGLFEAARHGVERPGQLALYAGALGLNIVMTGRSRNGSI